MTKLNAFLPSSKIILGIPPKISTYGVTKGDVPQLVTSAMKISRLIPPNPKKPDRRGREEYLYPRPLSIVWFYRAAQSHQKQPAVVPSYHTQHNMAIRLTILAFCGF